MKNFRKFILKVLDNMSVAFFGMVVFAFTEFLFGMFSGLHILELIIGIPFTICISLILVGVIGFISIMTLKDDDLK